VYDSFSANYDRFVNWPARLSIELPFIQRQLQLVTSTQNGDISVLDAACGTGMHAIALAKLGFKAAGADLSAGMIQKARLNAQAEDSAVRFEAVGFGGLADVFGLHAFDSVLCLGNSLPHLLSMSDLSAALADFAACLKPGGLLLIQNRNFDAVLSRQERWMEPQSHREEGQEWIFLRFYDFLPTGLLSFNILTLHQEDQSTWTQSVVESLLYPLRQVELSQALAAAGFRDITLYGNLVGVPFDPQTSGNLVISARIFG
jgi:glycine/sarcosine N-methyltransferase